MHHATIDWKESPGKGQKYEVSALEVVLVGACGSDYPLQKKRHSLDFLRGIAHLRRKFAGLPCLLSAVVLSLCRTNVILAVDGGQQEQTR